ncbi:MAG: MFS transporter [Candidatus Dactylopiibacterium carminicum]|uniref:MFS transporter n=1 Tax=Candidatus Dactylopiibacterium carminicum TaxID=857335 RepID=A0A272ETF6_9RHOO|nr:glycoside-pentoside-hexuronide (GPH):cation symporter [Candidatus Dactylopiibacterium carminicum]KAF7599371.1 MFS transporter [Candidatus Dactylopiibacterium carminicum]PAS93381.1 MAG: MFS transporter [Candidatus Dactylopiibacterium carminicum]PAS98334.1 MAG: MFS transporter [Candidatus Dactylopiibacterium carminicum]PAS99380.1 MAG: hypothetical protein BSR46_08430 [Candidatus Dactylopiibacterium carminicum]
MSAVVSPGAPGERLSRACVLAYGSGDVGNNIVHAMGMIFLLHYYTDVAGLGAAVAGTVLLAVRLYDAVVDLVIGRWLDSRSANARGERLRPFLLWGVLPLLLNVAVFSVPAHWSADARLLYAVISYALLGTAYSLVNIPYGALISAMTQDSHDHARLGAARSVMSILTFVGVSLLIGLLARVEGFGLQTTLTGAAALMAVLGYLCHLACHRGVRERVARKQPAIDWRLSLRTLRGNRPLAAVGVAAVLALGGASASSASLIYYARYVLGDGASFPWLILPATLLGMLVATPLAPRLAARYGKRQSFLAGVLCAALAHAVLFAVAPAGLPAAAALLGLGSIGLNVAMICLWALEADTVEYGEQRTGLRLEGTNYALFSLMRKLGFALGGAVPAFLLAHSDYVPNLSMQGPLATLVILIAVGLFPALCFLLARLVIGLHPWSGLQTP